MKITINVLATVLLTLSSFKAWGPTEELFGNYHFVVSADRTFANRFNVELDGKHSAGAQFTWTVTPESKGTIVFSPKSQPTITNDPVLPVDLSGPGVLNVQVLLTVPGERVLGFAGRLAMGTRDAAPKPFIRAAYMLPEVGDEVLINLTETPGAGRLEFTTDPGLGGKLLEGKEVSIQYGKLGRYRITSEASDRRNQRASAFLDLDVVDFMTLSNPCARPQGTSQHFRCTTPEEYEVCMIFLREAQGDYTCEDLSNPLNNAEKLAAGPPATIQSCSPSPDFPVGGWRCVTEPALEQCRRYLVGHQHLIPAKIRHCHTEDNPNAITSVDPLLIDGKIDPGAFYGVDFNNKEGVVRIEFDTPQPPPLNHQCIENVANFFGGTCSRFCDQSYFTEVMEAGAPEIPVIAGLSCNSPFVVGTISGLGDSQPRAATGCLSLLQNEPPGSKISYTSTTWMTVTGHYLWNNPRTGGTGATRWFQVDVVDAPTPATPLAVPTLVTCTN